MERKYKSLQAYIDAYAYSVQQELHERGGIRQLDGKSGITRALSIF